MFVEPTKLTLGSFLTEDWLPARRASLRPSTVVSYEQLIRNYVLPRIGGVRLQAVDGPMFNRLYVELAELGRIGLRKTAHGAGLAPKTVRNLHGVLRRSATRSDGVGFNATPAMPPIRQRVRVRR